MEGYKGNCSVDKEIVSKQVEELIVMYEALWVKSKTTLPNIGKKVGLLNKLMNQLKTDKFIKEIDKKLKNIEKIPSNSKLKESIKASVEKYEGSILGDRVKLFEFFYRKGYSTVTEDFIKVAKEFDGEIELYDISQALRNVWIMNSIQILLSIKVELTPSLFSYSMLYPYSDNYIDNPEVSLQEKVKFSNRLGMRLVNKSVEATNRNEMRIYDLISRIEGEYPRNLFPQVYEGLISIHRGQEKSFAQQRQYCTQDDINVLEISMEKGGTSVLADGYLVKGELTQQEASFMFGYGVFLQFIDDLQDIREDIVNQHETIFTKAVSEERLEEVTNRLFWFIDVVLTTSYIPNTKDSTRLIKIIKESCIMMMIEAIADNRILFKSEYIKSLEEYSLFRFVYYERLKSKLKNIFKSNEILLLSKS